MCACVCSYTFWALYLDGGFDGMALPEIRILILEVQVLYFLIHLLDSTRRRGSQLS